MTCRTVAEQIHPYVDGELAEPERVEVERHLAACPACREEVAAFEAIGRLLRRELTTAAGAAPSIWPAIADRLEAGGAGPAPSGRPVWLRRGARGRLPRRALVPALAAAAAVLVALTLQLEREPGVPPEQLAQVAAVEGGDRASVVLLAGSPSEAPIILVTEPLAPASNGGSPL